MAKAIAAFGRLDILVSNAGIQIVAPLDEFEFTKWKQLLAIHSDGAFLATRAALRQICKQGTGGSIIYMGSVHSKEASRSRRPTSRRAGKCHLVQDVAGAALFFAAFESNALTGQSLVVSHGWFMQ